MRPPPLGIPWHGIHVLGCLALSLLRNTAAKNVKSSGRPRHGKAQTAIEPTFVRRNELFIVHVWLLYLNIKYLIWLCASEYSRALAHGRRAKRAVLHSGTLSICWRAASKRFYNLIVFFPRTEANSTSAGVPPVCGSYEWTRPVYFWAPWLRSICATYIL